MLLTGHKSRAIFDRYNIIHEQELLDAGDQLVAYLAQQAQAPRGRAHPTDRRRRHAHRASPPPSATHHRVRAPQGGHRARRGWDTRQTQGRTRPQTLIALVFTLRHGAARRPHVARDRFPVDADGRGNATDGPPRADPAPELVVLQLWPTAAGNLKRS